MSFKYHVNPSSSYDLAMATNHQKTANFTNHDFLMFSKFGSKLPLLIDDIYVL